ncbi:MAG: SLC13 family permease, partial [Verrucomicrobiota bacterium]|nr:SLC13 family permease [Verrucomicrobiota bacterium]
LIASHHLLETQLGIEKNTILIIAPLFVAGLLMIWRNKRARHYIENEVEWWTLLFFMMLFAVAGTLEHTGVTELIAKDFSAAFEGNMTILTPIIIIVSALGSAFVDNVVFVAAFIPVVKELNATEFWWALLFGGCFGGNITMIGSTANIVALGMLEKRYRTQIKFMEWLKLGACVGLITSVIAWGCIYFMTPYMPKRSPITHSIQQTEQVSHIKKENL